HVLEKCGFEQCKSDPCVLRYVRDGVVCAVVAPHVDDLSVAGKIDVLIWVRSRIKEQFSMEDFGDLEYYLGCEISRDRTTQTVTISQTRYIKSVCQKFAMDGAKKRSVPHDFSRTQDKSENHPSVDTNTPYREAVGSLMWASVMTRVDIANAVRVVAKYSSNPKVTHWRAVKCILAYLNTCPSAGLSFGGFDTECELSVYADASYAGDWKGRRSVTGGAISWMSKVQRVVALSSTESEYIALSSVAQELLFLRGVLEFIQPQFPRRCIELFEDNDGACKLVRNAISFTRTKHIDVRHFLRDLSRKGEIRVVFVGTANQRADVLTKNLP
ncbi:unnamed protein product, partial [Choristocarpus tenellus]